MTSATQPRSLTFTDVDWGSTPVDPKSGSAFNFKNTRVKLDNLVAPASTLTSYLQITADFGVGWNLTLTGTTWGGTLDWVANTAQTTTSNYLGTTTPVDFTVPGTLPSGNCATYSGGPSGK
jgi:hypothetical protein